VDSCRQALAAVPDRRFILVFDLNGIFCHCIPRGRSSIPTWMVQDRAPDKGPALVGPKSVLPRLGYKQFWERMTQMFYVCIWSSMKKSTVDLVVEFLFNGMSRPAIVLGQEDCITFKDIWDNEIRNPLKPESILFFKSLNKTFWWPSISLHSGRVTATIENTVLVDDSPYKGACNPPGNVLFPDSFTTNKQATADMRAVLLPYFQRMFNSTMSDVRDFVITHRFGQQPVPHNDPVRESLMMANKHSNRPDLLPITAVPR
jgi:hypothetical protein